MNAPDVAVLLPLIPGEPQAFEPIYEYYHPRVFAYVAYRVGRAEDAEDIVADIFIRAVTNLHRFEHRGDGAFSAWLFRIAANEVTRFYQQNKRGTTIALDEMPEIQSGGLLPELQVQRKERFARLREMIDSLPARRQEVVRLRFFAELRNREIALILNLDERTVASNLSRALTDLRAMYAANKVED